MANKKLFKNQAPKYGGVSAQQVLNDAGGKAIAMDPEHALAQMACTGMLGSTFYASAETQLARVRAVAEKCSSTYLAQVAVHARSLGFMKDMPALLLVMLAARVAKEGSPGRPTEASTAFRWAFPAVIDNAKMLSTFHQMLWSGELGKKGMGKMVRSEVRKWLAGRTPNYLFHGSVGHTPDLASIIKMARPSPEMRLAGMVMMEESNERAATYAYLIDKMKPEQVKDLPATVLEYEVWKQRRLNGEKALPSEGMLGLPFQLLDGVAGQDDDLWRFIAAKAGWQMTRMNINTFQRHKVFEDPELVIAVGDRLADDRLIDSARVMPYQLMTALLNIGPDVPARVVDALVFALERTTRNIPRFEGETVVAVDVSGSMRSPVSDKSKATCVQVASLIAASIARVNPQTDIIPFDTRAYRADRAQMMVGLERQGVLGLAAQLSKYGGGGTSCEVVIADLLEKRQRVDTVIYVSDYESWFAHPSLGRQYFRTGMQEALRQYRLRINPHVKLICIDLIPHTTAQVEPNSDQLLVGGFTDAVWPIAYAWLKNKDPNAFVSAIKSLTPR